MIEPLADWALLRYFLEVGRAGSIVGAAERLSSSGPTIGRKLSQLEEAVGTKLLIRTTAGVDLTPAGKKIMAIAEKVEAVVVSAGLEVSTENELAGTIRFKGSDGIGGYWLPLMLSDFCSEFPYITVEATCTSYTEIPDLSRREADITVVYRAPTDPDVCVLARSELVLKPVAARAYAETNGLPQTFEQLLKHRLCLHDSYLVEANGWGSLAGLFRRHTRVVYRTNSSLALGQALRLGIGVSYFPVGVADREPDLVFFDIEGFAPRMPFWLVCHKDVKDVPAVRAVINHVRKALFDRSLQGSMSRSQLDAL